jgi:CubicO group peptidase (beta-lactamase class C family)
VGASFAAVLCGEIVVDIWGGHLDAARTQPWQRDSIVNVFSTTKTMAALCALMLADRGLLDVHAPVARYWPEFAQAGKAQVTTAHVLSHAAGLSGLDVQVAVEDLFDHPRIAALLAAQAPWWPPGTASGYHAITQGNLLGEIVRRITGRTLGAFFREEVAAPLGADFHIGFGAEHDRRVGLLIPPPPAPLTRAAEGSVSARTFRSPPLVAAASHSRAWRAAEIPAAGGHGNARSVAMIQGALANGGEAFGVRLLSTAGAWRALEKQVDGTDLVLGTPIAFALGFGLPGPLLPVSPNPHACFWGGWGGSTVVVDFDARLAFSYVMNRMAAGALGDPRGAALNRALYRCLQH